MTVLVTGGAGYIGAHVVRLLVGAGRDVVVVDDLSTGARSRVGDVPVIELDLAGSGVIEPLAAALVEHAVGDVIHLAARKRVDESIRRPVWYYQQNVGGLANVVMAMEIAGTRRLVFSSSAAVYGEVTCSVVDERAPARPVNPYGETKLAGEWLVRDAVRAGAITSVALRYFNVAGAGWDDLGDLSVTNLVAMVLDRLTRGEAPVIFGADYPTPDGTCVRDFVHVLDVARAHVAALDHLSRRGTGFDALNIGTGRGVSVATVVEQLSDLVGSGTEPLVRPRRPGDPSHVVASVRRVEEVLGWRAQATVAETLRSAWTAWDATSQRPSLA